jgi:hypothetical protein
MALGPERHRDAAGFAWRALGLVVALRLSQGVSGSWAVPWTLYAGGIAAWIALGWKARWSGAAAAAVAVGIVAAGRLAYGLPAAVLWFVPVWAVFFGLPLLLRLRGGAHRAAAWLARRLGGLGPPLRAGVHWLGRYPRTREGLRIAAAGGAGLYAIGPFLHDGIMGGVDARWYTSVVADFLNQWRMGLGPVFVGQTYLAPLGTVMPLRVAPYLQHATLALDLVTGRRLSAYALLNLAVVASSVAGCVSAYLCLRAVLPGRRLEALLLAVIYGWCPAVVGMAYTGQLFMSVMTLPYLPVAFAGVVRIHDRDDFSGWAMVAAGCAACWLCHSPIGMWVTFAAAVAVAARWACGFGRSRRELGRSAGAFGLFLALCGYVFVSIRILAAPKQPPISVPQMLSDLGHMFPAALLPVSATASMLSDLQPGWGVGAALLLPLAAAWRIRLAAARPLLIAAAVLLLLSMPVPGVNELLWRAVPQAVLDATNAAPTQRLFPILAACSVVLAARTLAARPRRSAALLFFLGVAVPWGGVQLQPVLRRGAAIANSREASEEQLAPNNFAVPIFSTGLLGGVSAFFSYGFMDYGLEERVLDRDMKTYLVSNAGAIAPGFDFGQPQAHRRLPGVFHGKAAADGRPWIELAPKITLAAGQHYLLAFDFLAKSYTGALQAKGPGVAREYYLPASGGRLAFGSADESSRVIPLFNPSGAPIEMALDFVVQDPKADLAWYTDFARYALIPYDPADLPIHLKAYAPLVSDVRSPAPGWFESFRYYTLGWTATVNGRPSEVRATGNAMIAVPIPAGESEVRLSYKPPPALLLAYLLTGAAWLGLVFAGAKCALRR